MNWRGLAVVALTIPMLVPAQSANLSDTTGNVAITASIDLLPVSDRLAIQKHLEITSSELRATAIETARGKLFFVQATGNFFCSPTGNCSLWVLDVHYDVVLKTVAQSAKILKSNHQNRPDIQTTMHGSATSADRKQWHFQDTGYVVSACAVEEYANANGVPYPRPHITPYPCH